MSLNHYVVTTVDCGLAVRTYGFNDPQEAVNAYVEEAERGLAGTPDENGDHLALVRMETFINGTPFSVIDTKDALECEHNRRGDVTTTASSAYGGGARAR